MTRTFGTANLVKPHTKSGRCLKQTVCCLLVFNPLGLKNTVQVHHYRAGVLFCLIALLNLCPRTSLADGITLDGVSAVTIGRGGTNQGFADNGSMIHDNPGAMGQMEADGMFQLGINTMLSQFDYGDADNVQQRSQNQVYPLPEIAWITRLNSQWTVGFGLYTPTGFGSVYNLNGPAPVATGPQRYESFGSLSKVLFGASYTPVNHEYISFGGTIGPGISFLNLEGPYTLQGPTATGLPGILDMGLEGAGLTWSAGVSCQLTSDTSIGLSYLADVKVQADGHVALTTPLGNNRYETETEIKWPRTIGGGVRHQLDCRTVVAVDLMWTNWSDAFDHLDLYLSDPSNVGYPPNAVERFPLNWRDTFSTRIGIERIVAPGHTARAGYVHHKNAIPSGTINPWIPAALEHAFSLGYGVEAHSWDVNFAYMYSFGPTVNVGTSDFVGGDFDNSVHRNRTHCVAFSLTRKFGSGCEPCR